MVGCSDNDRVNLVIIVVICLVYRQENVNCLLSCEYLYTIFHWFNLY